MTCCKLCAATRRLPPTQQPSSNRDVFCGTKLQSECFITPNLSVTRSHPDALNPKRGEAADHHLHRKSTSQLKSSASRTSTNTNDTRVRVRVRVVGILGETSRPNTDQCPVLRVRIKPLPNSTSINGIKMIYKSIIEAPPGRAGWQRQSRLTAPGRARESLMCRSLCPVGCFLVSRFAAGLRGVRRFAAAQ